MLRGRRLGKEPGAVTIEPLHRPEGSKLRARSDQSVALGERLVFGDASNRVCLLGTLIATVTDVGARGELELSFEYRDEILAEMLAAVED
jgi:hypothetical protein